MPMGVRYGFFVSRHTTQILEKHSQDKEHVAVALWQEAQEIDKGGRLRWKNWKKFPDTSPQEYDVDTKLLFKRLNPYTMRNEHPGIHCVLSSI